MRKNIFITLIAVAAMFHGKDAFSADLRAALIAKVKEDLAKGDELHKQLHEQRESTFKMLTEGERSIPVASLELLYKAEQRVKKEDEIQKARHEAAAQLFRALGEPMAESSAAVAPAVVAPVGACDECHEPVTKVFRCSRCKQVKYCGLLCQRAAWLTHKEDCNANSVGVNLNHAKK